MDLNQIRYFVHLADTLNFTEAARLSGVSQPSLTKGIQRLEEELGGPLIYRDGKDSRLTALGREMQVEFMQIEARLSSVRELAENSLRGRKRVLTMGVMTTIGPSAMSPFLDHVLTQLPGIELHITPMLPGENEAETLSGKYDLVVLPQPPSPNFKVANVPLFTEPIKLAVAHGHPLSKANEVTLQQIADEVYIDRLHCDFRTQIIDHFMDRDVILYARVQSEREDWVQQLVASGLGVCCLPGRSRIVPGIELRPIRGFDAARQVSLVAVSVRAP
ncbi:MAG: LysR family transcriptional regulator [Hyphomicrobiales bacterium]|nr:LysR family transcriptional regulator [Hyphomicrobiales bacterium]